MRMAGTSFYAFVAVDPPCLLNWRARGAKNTWTMVEGHQVQRLAWRYRKKLVGLKFAADSPNERFRDGASLIHQKTLTQIEAHGKNLFLIFGGPLVQTEGCQSVPEEQDDKHEAVVCHIHFGMSGQFRTMRYPGRCIWQMWC